MVSNHTTSNHSTVIEFNPNNIHQSLLEQVEAAGITTNAQCRDGFCGACRVELIEGHVEYCTEPLAVLNEDQILLCACRATTEVKIKL